jgi:hypothetical protein
MVTLREVNEKNKNEEISPALLIAKERVEKVVTENLVENLAIAPLINQITKAQMKLNKIYKKRP